MAVSGVRVRGGARGWGWGEVDAEPLGSFHLHDLAGVDGDLDDAVAEVGDRLSDGLEPGVWGGWSGYGRLRFWFGLHRIATTRATIMDNIYSINRNIDN